MKTKKKTKLIAKIRAFTPKERRLAIAYKYAIDFRAKAKLAMLTNTDPPEFCGKS